MRLEVRFLWPASLAPHLSPGLGPQGSAAAGGGEPATCLQASSRDSVSGAAAGAFSTCPSQEAHWYLHPWGGASWHLDSHWQMARVWHSGRGKVSQLLGIPRPNRGNVSKNNFPTSGGLQACGRSRIRKIRMILLDFGGHLVWPSHLIGKDSEAQRRQEAPFFSQSLAPMYSSVLSTKM